MFMDIDEIVDYVSEENPEAIMFRNPDFYDAIVGYIINEEDLPVLVYDYSKMVECLAEEFEELEDPIMSAMEFIDYNTIRALPYINAKGRPVILYN